MMPIKMIALLTMAALAVVFSAAPACADVPRYSPTEIALDGSGNVYVIMDEGAIAGEGLYVYGTSGTELKSYLRPGCADVAIDGRGTVYVVDLPDKRVERLEKNGSFSVVWREDKPDHFINYFAVDRDNNILLSDFNYSNELIKVTDGRILKISPDGRVADVIGSDPTVSLASPFRLSTADNGTIYTTNFTRCFSAIYPDGSRSLISHSSPDNGTFNQVSTVEAGEDGYLYLGETSSGRVQKLAPDGTVIATWDGCGPDRFITPGSIVATRDGRVYVSDTQDQRVVWFDGNRYKFGDNVTANLAGKGVLWDVVLAGDNYSASQQGEPAGDARGTPGFGFAGALAGIGLAFALLCHGLVKKG